MIYIIVGSTNAGKSSLTRNTFLNGGYDVDVRKDITIISETDNCVLIGDYSRRDRRAGTDTIPRQDIVKMGEQVEALINTNKDIVLEGTRCISRPLFNKLLSLNVDITLIWVQCSVETSYKRTNASISLRMCKRDNTASKNIFYEYKDRMNGIIINTDDVTDFTKLHL